MRSPLLRVLQLLLALGMCACWKVAPESTVVVAASASASG
jgi:hypothetical protein